LFGTSFAEPECVVDSSSTGVTRREICYQLAAAAALSIFSTRLSALGATTARTFVIGSDAGLSADAAAGISMGIREALRAARQRGRTVRRQPQLATAHARIVCRSAAAQPAMPTMDLGERRPTAPRKDCEFRLAPDEATRAAIIETWRASADGPAAPGAVTLAVWHPSLTDNGAADLNQRFEQFASRPMTSEAWLGWCAVKALSEAWLAAGADSLCQEVAEREFDGHKGQPLRFDPATGVLLQPMYIVSDDQVIGVVPPMI
jgi:hypothetical protein